MSDSTLLILMIVALLLGNAVGFGLIWRRKQTTKRKQMPTNDHDPRA